jgi:hypothetical protein
VRTWANYMKPAADWGPMHFYVSLQRIRWLFLPVLPLTLLLQSPVQRVTATQTHTQLLAFTHSRFSLRQTHKIPPSTTHLAHSPPVSHLAVRRRPRSRCSRSLLYLFLCFSITGVSLGIFRFQSLRIRILHVILPSACLFLSTECWTLRQLAFRLTKTRHPLRLLTIPSRTKTAMAPNDIDRLRHGFSAVQISDHIEATPPTPTTPTSRMHLLSGLRTAPKTQTPAKVPLHLEAADGARPVDTHTQMSTE